MCRLSTLRLVAWWGLVALGGTLAASQAARAQSPMSDLESADAPVADAEQASPAYWGWLPKPEITWPQVTLPSVAFPKFDRSMASNVFAPVKSGVAKISAGSRRAWDGTKEIFSFAFGSSKDDSRLASRKTPTMWERMFGGPRDDGPQTIGEFMSGTRPQ